MKALTFHGKENVCYETVADPQILSSQDAIIKVFITAICGSDLHVYHEREKGLDHGTVMGHEFVGEIVEVGKDVKHFSKGDVVMSPFTTSCGKCFYCLKGLTCRCEQGQLYGWVEDGCGLHGGQAEFVRVPIADSTLVKVPPGVSLEEALLLGDILSTGYYCADRAEIEESGIYAVVGCGPVGLMSVIAAKELGAQTVYAIDSVDERLNLAKEYGATPINYAQQNPVEVVANATDGRGADAVLEVVGSLAAGRSAANLVRPGGIISVVGVHTSENFAFSPVEAYNKNLTYKIGRCPARHYMEKLIPLVQSKKYDLKKIISHTIPLEEGKGGYKIFAEKLENCTKLVLKIT